jgi:hypothetical protein
MVLELQREAEVVMRCSKALLVFLPPKSAESQAMSVLMGPRSNNKLGFFY